MNKAELEKEISSISKIYPEVSFAKLSRIAVHFAKWQEEQMMNEAVEGKVYDFRRIKEIGYSSAKIEFDKIPELDDGDKVHIIIVKED